MGTKLAEIEGVIVKEYCGPAGEEDRRIVEIFRVGGDSVAMSRSTFDKIIAAVGVVGLPAPVDLTTVDLAKIRERLAELKKARRGCATRMLLESATEDSIAIEARRLNRYRLMCQELQRVLQGEYAPTSFDKEQANEHS